MFCFLNPSRGVCAALVCLAVNGTIPSPCQAAPQLVIADPIFDFGEVHNEAPISHAFRLTNAGDAPLSIVRIRPSCPDCTRYHLDRDTIPPGESATLMVTLDPLGLEEDVEKELTLDSNDPNAPHVTLWLQGTITPRFHCRPEKAIIEQASSNVTGSAQVTITPLRVLNLPLTEVTSDSPFIFGAVAPGGGGNFELQIFTRPPLPTGIQHGRLRIFSADTNDPACLVKVDVGVWPGFLAVPDTLRLASAAEGQMRILFVRQFPDTPHSVTGVEATTSNLTFEIYPEPAGLNYRIYVFVHGPVAVEEEVTILIHTDDPEQPTLSVPVIFER